MDSFVEIKYNSQRNNYQWNKKLRFWTQCWYTSSIMFLSRFLPEAESKQFELDYIDSTEYQIGKSGIAEQVMSNVPWLSKMILNGTRSGAFYITHQKAIQIYLNNAGFTGRVVCDRPTTWNVLSESLNRGFPVILSTKLTSSGHILLVIGETDDCWIIHDPYGNAYAHANRNPLSGYKIDRNGEYVAYPKKWMEHYAGKLVTGSSEKCYIIWYDDTKSL